MLAATCPGTFMSNSEKATISQDKSRLTGMCIVVSHYHPRGVQCTTYITSKGRLRSCVCWVGGN